MTEFSTPIGDVGGDGRVEAAGEGTDPAAAADPEVGAPGTAATSDRVRIFDTTLRDGEQAPGIALTKAEKVEIAEQLARLNVDVIEAGFPVSSDGEFEAVREIAATVRGPVIAALARVTPGDIHRAAEALKGADRWRIHTFISTSDIHMNEMLRMSHDQVLDGIREGVRLAVGYTEDVEFSAQDATRTELAFLLDCFRVAVDAGATTINVPDTVGYAMPHEFGELVRIVREAVPEDVTISTHCHNDLGLAVANALAGIVNGARQTEVAVNGIGERAGNCSLEEIAMIVRTRAAALGVDHDLNAKEIIRTSRLVSMTTGYSVQPNKAVVGASAFAHESGIHQHGVLSNAATYEIMDPIEVGLEGNRLVLGKHSGRHAFNDALVKMGYELDREHLDRSFARFKELADRKIQITDQDLAAIVAEELGAADEDFLLLESLQMGGGTHLSPTASVRLRRGDEIIEESAMGDGMIDAACGAIQRAAGVEARLVNFNVSSVTAGSDALGDVVVQLDIEGRRVTGRGVSVDVVEASARAYLAAINRALSIEATESAAGSEGPRGTP
jgi:2-isopropylmalate synthase